MKTSDIITGVVVWIITLILDAVFKYLKKRISTRNLRNAARRIWIGAGSLLVCALSAQAAFAGFFAYVLQVNPLHRPGVDWQSALFFLLGIGSFLAALSTQRDLYEFGLSRGRHIASTQTAAGPNVRLNSYMAASRLGNVLTAIQVMGVNQQAAMKVSDWHQLLGNPKDEAGWDMIFGEHPEFFKLNGEWAVLRMRLAYVPLYNTRTYAVGE